MMPIDSSSKTEAGYFYNETDETKAATAVRATYEPSISNRITNKFAHERPWLAGIANSVRELNLNTQKRVNKHLTNKARERLEHFNTQPQATSLTHAQYEQRLGKLERKAERLDTKTELGQQALKGNLYKAVVQETQDWQEDLRKRGYVKLSGLRATKHASESTNYLVAKVDGHRIKINSERPPLLARWVANSVSARYDNGSSGAGPRALSIFQHALVGISSAQESIKGMAARNLAKNPRLDEGARARMDVRAARAEQKRAQLHASLGGNVALNQAYRQTVAVQQENANRREQAGDPVYERRSNAFGVKPPHIPSVLHKIDHFYHMKPASPAAQSQGAAGEVPVESRKAGRMARFALGVFNLRAKASTSFHQHKEKIARNKEARATDHDEKTYYGEQARYHGAAASRSSYQISTGSSALQGTLIETIKSQKMREQMDRIAPRVRQGDSHSLNRLEPGRQEPEVGFLPEFGQRPEMTQRAQSPPGVPLSSLVGTPRGRYENQGPPLPPRPEMTQRAQSNPEWPLSSQQRAGTQVPLFEPQPIKPRSASLTEDWPLSSQAEATLGESVLEQRAVLPLSIHDDEEATPEAPSPPPSPLPEDGYDVPRSPPKRLFE